MLNKLFLTAIFIGMICGALSYWFNPYNEVYIMGINIYYLMASLAFLSSITMGFIDRTAIFKIPVYFCVGFVISALGRIFYDISNDPSTHNLFPFEIIFILVIIVPATFAGAFLIDFVNSKRK